MTLPGSGAISLSQVNTELQLASSAVISMNDTAVRTLAGVPSGAITMSSLYGKSSTFIATITIPSSTGNIDLRALANAAGYNGNSGATITFVAPNGTVCRPAKLVNVGLDAITTGSWPTGSFSINLTIIVQSGAIIDGAGGNGAEGGVGFANSGGFGGNAFTLTLPVTGGITIDAGGTVRGGGGGGGGTAGVSPFKIGGNGGGGGAPNGFGGDGGEGSISNGSSGHPGTLTGGGLPNGGTFGTAGTIGSGSGGAGAGGAAGYAVYKAGFTTTVTNNGTMIGLAA